MADEVVDGGADTGVTDDAAAREAAGTPPEAGSDTGEKAVFFGKYKSKEDAEKGWAEREKLFGQQTQELGELRRQMETLSSQAQLAEAIKSLKESVSHKPEEKGLDFEEWGKKFAEKYDMPEGAVRELMSVNSGWISRETEAAKAEIKRARDEFAEQLKAIREQQAQLSDRQLKSSPEYQESKALIDVFVKRGMSLRDAMESAAEIKSVMPAATVQRESPPASIDGSRVSASGKGKATSWFSDEDRAELKASGLTDAEIAAFEKERLTATDGKGA